LSAHAVQAGAKADPTPGMLEVGQRLG